MNFSEALIILKEDHEIARKVWNKHVLALSHGAAVQIGLDAMPKPPFYIMKITNGSLMQRWEPTQEDILSEDWYLVDTEIRHDVLSHAVRDS